MLVQMVENNSIYSNNVGQFINLEYMSGCIGQKTGFMIADIFFLDNMKEQECLKSNFGMHDLCFYYSFTDLTKHV